MSINSNRRDQAVPHGLMESSAKMRILRAMKRFFVSVVATVLSVTCSSTCLEAAELISRKTDTGVIVGYKDTPLQPWTDNKYCVHDPDCPPPRFVLPRPLGTPLPAAPIPRRRRHLIRWHSNRSMESIHVESRRGCPFGRQRIAGVIAGLW